MLAAMRLTVLAVLALAACPTPYQQAGVLSDGYSDKQLDDGNHAISVTVNRATSRDTAVDYLQQRAAELCPDGYDTLDRSSDEGERIRFTRRNPGVVSVPDGTSIEAAVIHCNDAPATPTRPDARFTHAVFYCFTGDCTQSKDTCEQRRTQANVDGACAQTTAVYCTSFLANADHSRRRACMPDRKRCNDRRDTLGTSGEYADLSACYAMLDDRKQDSTVAAHFYCAHSPTDPDLSACARNSADCDAERAKIGKDLAPCALADTATCFYDGETPVCAATAHACAVRRDRHFEHNAGTGVPVGACTEAH